MIKGAAKIPIAVIISSAKERVPRVLSIRFFVSFLSCSSLYSVKTGTKAVEKAPSAVTLLKKFGILNATKNASNAPFMLLMNINITASLR